MKPGRSTIVLALAAACGSAHAAVRVFLVDRADGRLASGSVSVFRGGRLVWWAEATGSVVVPLARGTGALVVPINGRAVLQNGPPERELTIVVRASRLAAPRPPAGSAGTTRDQTQLHTFTNTASGDAKGLVSGQSGVAEDSAGQAHVRGEHAEISYVVDGVALPDTLAGRQGSVVVPDTIARLDMLTGGFAPEFGGQTAAVLNIVTLPGARKFFGDLALQGGDYSSYNGDLTAQGPLGARASYVFDVGEHTTQNAEDSHQPTVQDAHNGATSRSYFADFRFAPSARDALSLTLSQNPNALQISNRAGLGSYFASVGEGYGFLGLRNADGSRPDAAGSNALGAGNIVLPSQAAEHMAINQDEVSEFATLNYRRKLGANAESQLAVTTLHAGQSLWNQNPAVDPTRLPIDDSIEYDPTVSRNVHHTQAIGNIVARRGGHTFKVGFLYDSQSGVESYHIVPASQLALDELAALDGALAPPGAPTGATDVDGNPVYKATGASPTLRATRSGAYAAAYAQDTWRSGRLTVDYGLRADWFNQRQDLGQAPVDASALSPRLNFEYRSDRRTDLRASYDRLFNTPPLAQGAIVGASIQPERLSQYDLGVSRTLKRGQTAEIAYYYKDIRDQVDTGLLVPGSDIGLYSAVNFQRGAVHGIELSYDFEPAGGHGWDGYVNYSHSLAAPEGLDNTGAPAPEFNDHDQRDTVGAGLAYTWPDGATVAATFEFGSGLASGQVFPTGTRVPRFEVGLHASTGPLRFDRRLAFTLDVQNLTDQRTVINFDSGFSGTRFMQGRTILVGLQAKF